jgi:RNA polymerase sigma-70 factor, ECF subfamily
MKLAEEEKELISQISNNDKNAFKVFIEKYQKFVINVCYKFVNNPDDANDVAQEVFIEVYKTAGKFRFESKIQTWLYRIAVNKSLNFLRDNKKYRDIQSYSDTQKPDISPVTENSPESEYLSKERKKVLDMAIDSLPEMQKAAFILNKKEFLSYEEASKIMGFSLKAFDSLMSRAKKNLQKKLIKYYKQ